MIRVADKNVKKSICIIITTVLIFEDEIFSLVGAVQTVSFFYYHFFPFFFFYQIFRFFRLIFSHVFSQKLLR